MNQTQNALAGTHTHFLNFNSLALNFEYQLHKKKRSHYLDLVSMSQTSDTNFFQYLTINQMISSTSKER